MLCQRVGGVDPLYSLEEVPLLPNLKSLSVQINRDDSMIRDCRVCGKRDRYLFSGGDGDSDWPCFVKLSDRRPYVSGMYAAVGMPVIM